MLSGSDTEVKVQITSILNQYTLNVDLFLPIGIPEGLEELTINTGFTLTPKLLSLDTHTGSPGGTLLTAVVKGLGANATGVTLVTSSGTDVCESVTIP